MNTKDKSIYSALTTALIICDALITIISCIFCHHFIFLLLSTLNTLLCIFFGYILAFYMNIQAVDKLGFILSIHILLVHIFVIIISSMFWVQFASYTLGLDPLVLLAYWFYIRILQGRIQIGIHNPLHVQIEEALKPKKFDIKELVAATGNFKYLVATGSYITVFSGRLPSGKVVAVLRFNSPKDHSSISAFVNEIINTSDCKHDNIRQLFGYCLTNEFVYFIYEYMWNHRVKDWIFSENTIRRKTLTITRRHQVGVDVAKALDYLYNHCNNFHIDANPTNILLNETFKAKVANFGLWKFLAEKKNGIDDIPTKNTICQKSLEESNVYRYGLLLLELVSGQKHWRWCEDGVISSILHWKLKEGKVLELVDQVLEINEGDEQKIEVLLTVAMLCTQQRAEDRPSMAQVVAILTGYEVGTLPKDIPMVFRESNNDDISIVAHNYSPSYDDTNILIWYS